MKDIGILVHGRHLQTKDWELVEWGEPPNRLGVLPRFVLEVPVHGPERIRGVVFGTGASHREGSTEAEYTKQFLLDQFDSLVDFNLIKPYADDLPAVRALVEAVVIDNESMNTRDEIRSAAELFAEWGCRGVYQVTNASHAPRCLLEMLKICHAGGIPYEQRWYPVADDMTYSGTDISDVVVIEPPHRGDDPMLDVSIQMHEVIPKFFKLAATERVAELQKLNERLNEQQNT